jgi:hypothetical protein
LNAFYNELGVTPGVALVPEAGHVPVVRHGHNDDRSSEEERKAR